MKRLVLIVLGLVAVSSVVRADYVGLATGSGSLNVGATWIGGILPSGSSTGLITTANNIWFGNAWNNLAVRQTGGYIYAAAGQSVNLRGGLSGSGITTVYEIEDPRTDYLTYTNAYIGDMVMWSQYGEAINFNLLSGRVVVTNNMTFNSTQAVMNVKNGLFTSLKSTMTSGRLNMLTAGDADVYFGQLTTTGLNVAFNFETGNTGTVTIDKISTGEDFTLSQWNFMAGNGKILVNGVAVSDLSLFHLTNNNKTISLISRPAVIRLVVITSQ